MNRKTLASSRAQASQSSQTPFRSAVLVALGCAGVALVGCSKPSGDSAERLSPEVARGDALPVSSAIPASVRRFDEYADAHRDLTYRQLLTKLKVTRTPESSPVVDPSRLDHYSLIKTVLQMTPAEEALFARNGVVSVDHSQRYSMGSAYYAIYARDLPVFITTDSILHAWHRSFANAIQTLEAQLFYRLIEGVLEATHDELAAWAAQGGSGASKEELEDVDLYISVARNLLAGAGGVMAPGDPTPDWDEPPQVLPARVLIASKLGVDARVKEILQKILSLQLERFPGPATALNGGERYVDYSQFRPRGHYTDSFALQRYFRAMQWLGRADTGFVVTSPQAMSGLVVDVQRERASAALLARLMQSSGQLSRLGTVSNAIDYLIGESTALSPGALAEALSPTGAPENAAPGSRQVDAAFERLFRAGGGAQSIRSQTLYSPKNQPTQVRPPRLFQVFGQRFVIDSFVLSKVVYDSISYRGKKQERLIPSGLDVMASFGNNEATMLLSDELQRWGYSANLLAARKVTDGFRDEDWDQSIYNQWLNALRTLDDVPPSDSVHFPKAMRARAWQHKQLQAQLSSWAQLRHDTILYSSPSYTSIPGCEYPGGYVEPYPEFYRRIGRMARGVSEMIAAMPISAAVESAEDDGMLPPGIGPHGMVYPHTFNPGSLRIGVVDASTLRTSLVTSFLNFAETTDKLEALARKELAAQPFSAEDALFLKKTIDIRSEGSGPPRYDGWYANLIYGEFPAEYRATVADVHTDPKSSTAVEVAVGDVNFLVVAIDNEGYRAAYVGPIYSYYEFQEPVSTRLTDGAWEGRIEAGQAPPRPAWTSSFVTAAKRRSAR